MKRINLFDQYVFEALVNKARKQIREQVAQWSSVQFLPSQIYYYMGLLKDSVSLSPLEIEFLQGKEIVTERIFPLEEMQPGARPGRKVKLQVLRYTYQFCGDKLLLGCRPSGSVPEPVGEWFVDSPVNEICVEYRWYERNPRKTISQHQYYIEQVHQTFQRLQNEFKTYEESIDFAIEEAVRSRRMDLERHSKLLSILESQSPEFQQNLQ